MIRIITLSEDDILFDADAAGKALDKAVRRYYPLRFTGVCPIGRDILFVFNECREDDPDDGDAHFVFSKLPSRDFNEVSAIFLSVIFLKKNLHMWIFFRTFVPKLVKVSKVTI